MNAYSSRRKQEESPTIGMTQDQGLQNMTIILLGNDKAGKTSTGNIILNYDGLPKINYNNEKGDPVFISATTEDIPGKFIKVIDTHSFGVSREKMIESIKKKKDKCSSVCSEFSVLFVVRANNVSDRDCSESVQNFEEVFGRQFSGRTIVVVTHLDKVGGNMNDEIFIGSCGAQLRSFIGKHKLRVCYFDNLTDNSDIRKSQVNNLISMIVSEENTMTVNEENTMIVSEENTMIVSEENMMIVSEVNTMSISEEKKMIVSEKKTWSWIMWLLKRWLRKTWSRKAWSAVVAVVASIALVTAYAAKTLTVRPD